MKVYLIDYHDYHHGARWLEGEAHLLDVSADHRNIHNFPISHGATSLFIIAEKGKDSTWNERTSQGVYRLDSEWAAFDSNLERVKASTRPPVSFRKRANRKGGAPGFIYVGTIDSFGSFSNNPGLKAPDGREIVVDIGKPFQGYGWGVMGEHDGIGWRWVDGESVVLVDPPRGSAIRIDARIHTALDMESIRALRVAVNDSMVDSEVGSGADGHVLCARVEECPAGDAPVEIKFVGAGVALSEVRVVVE